MENNAAPLVSIVVITYNSAPFVIETLESIKAQTYSPLELVVSDDCSTDNTVDICSRWLADNGQRFVATRLVTVEKNTGISPNCNRGVNAAQGEWIKTIAGDDALEPDAIARYVQQVQLAPEIRFLYANIKPYINTFEEANALPVADISKWEFNLPQTSRERQIEILAHENKVWAATFFFARNLYLQVGGCDEKYPFFDDKPLLMRVLNSGHKIYFLNAVTAKYRKSQSSVQLSSKLLSRHVEEVLLYNITELKSIIGKEHHIDDRSHLEAKRLIASLTGNRKNIFTLAAFFLLYYLLRAFYIAVFSVKKLP
ncbi:glycosyltransferase family 2 protein [Rhodoflexus caldus]|uniref:glycosyltransferase family 2 protein n=1 Tax=Rhodoflexus caldus TaxID=2891236 RepID=UPI00202A6323|nr:glycosyltransferase [Rhodoflexus caldus]